MSDSRKVTIYFTDGTDVSFRFPQQDLEEASIKSVMDRVFNHQLLMLEGDGALHMFPYNNIKYIKVTPAGDVLPEGTITGVQLLG
jgi:hypothetical protein